MTIITEAMFNVAAVAFWGKAGAAAAAEDERDGLRAALETFQSLIEAARLREFADELMQQRNQVTCADSLSESASGYFRGRKDGVEQAMNLARAVAKGEPTSLRSA